MENKKPFPTGKAGPGRPKGLQNKTTALLKEAILQAAEAAGGGPPEGLAAYLQAQAQANPGPFLSLLGKVLPLQVTGEGGGPIQVEKIERVIVDSKVEQDLPIKFEVSS